MQNGILTIHQPDFLPYWGFFQKLASAEAIVWLDNVSVSKGGWANRNRILSSQGPQWLTVPVHKHFKLPYSKTYLVTGLKSRRKCVRTLEVVYGRARHYREICEVLFPIFLQPQLLMLTELNLQLLHAIQHELDIDAKWYRSSELDVHGSKSELLVDICKSLGYSTYLSGAGGCAYLDKDLFQARGIDVKFIGCNHPQYQQIHSKQIFQLNLSIIDILFNIGFSNTSDLLKEAAEGYTRSLSVSKCAIYD